MEELWDLLETEASLTNCKDREVACIIYDIINKEIIGIGHNQHIDSECDCATTKTGLHAEQAAIASMQTTRLKGQLIALINYKPCCNCASSLDKIVKEVRYRSQKS